MRRPRGARAAGARPDGRARTTAGSVLDPASARPRRRAASGVLLCAHLDTVVPQAADRPGGGRAAAGRTPRQASSAPTTRPPSRCCSRWRARRGVRAPPVGSSCCSPCARRTRLEGAKAFDAGRLRSRLRLRLRPRHADRRGHPRLADLLPARGRLPRRRRARRHPPRGGPQRDRRRGARDRRDAPRPPRRGDHRQRRRDRGRGGRDQRRARALPRRGRVRARSTPTRAEALVAEMVDHVHDGANAARVRRRRRRPAAVHGLPARSLRRPRSRPPRRRCARAATSRARIVTRRRVGRQRASRRQASVREPRQRHRAQPRADRAREPSQRSRGCSTSTSRSSTRCARC